MLTKKYMKTFLTLFLFTICTINASAQNKQPDTVNLDTAKKTQLVDASCGQCQFGLKGKGCNLAVRINGQAYFVDGSDIDSHGDAHADDGFCKKIRKAKVQGEVVDNRFKATYFQLLPETAKKNRS
jgi:uncharacterized protein (DUF1684 family)